MLRESFCGGKIGRWRQPNGGRSKKLARDAVFKECVLLVKHGVPFDVALSMDNAMRLAWLVVVGQSEGNKWNWGSMSWEPND